MKKVTTIKICILLALLTALTIVFAQQKTVVRVKLDRDTLVRNGQHLNATVLTSRGERIGVSATTPYYSIYEYIINIPANVWAEATQIRLEFGQVRRGDHIYIESVSVKQPFFNKQEIGNSSALNGLYKVNSADIGMTGSNLIDIEVLATRAHTAAMNTEGPSFSLPMDILNASEVLSYTYILSVLAVIAAWALAAFAVPRRVYAQIPEKFRELIDAIKCLSVMDITIILLGITSLVFNFYGSRISHEYGDFPFNLFSAAAVLLIIVKVMNTERPLSGMPERIEQSLVRVPEWMTYLLLLALSAAVYIPAAFPNPYFSNDEFQVIRAAEWYLSNGNFEDYNRAWPHTWLVAQVIKVFGLSTMSTRLLSAVFGIFFIISAYYTIGKLSRQRDVAFLSAVLLLCNPQIISIFATVRMYAIMLPASLWMLYCIYMTLHHEIEYERDNAITRFINKNFNFHFGHAAATILLIWLNFTIHTNSMILLLCAFLYVVLFTEISKQKKFINLSLVGIGIIVLASVIYFLGVLEVLEIPAVSPLIKFIVNSRLKEFVGLGQKNYNYFWTNIDKPLGSYLGIMFLLTSLMAGVKIYRQNRGKYLVYSIICYFITVVFFTFFTNRYYSYVYMAFIAPVTIMLISTGFYELTARMRAGTRTAMHLLILSALIFQMGSTFSRIYIDNPGDTKFERPYMILANDAKNEGLDTVPLFYTFARRYFNEIVTNGDTVGSMSIQPGEVYELDKWVDRATTRLEQPVAYFFSEQSKWWHTRGANGEFLEAGTDLITNIDASVVRKYHIVIPERIDAEQSLGSHDDILHIADVRWEDDVAYLQCSMSFIAEFDGAVFIAMEVAEQGIAQHAAHRFQVFVPDDFNGNDILSFNIALRPKTEEYCENIKFNTMNRAFVYYGMNEFTTVEFSK